jgi:hypothetical protein
MTKHLDQNFGEHLRHTLNTPPYSEIIGPHQAAIFDYAMRGIEPRCGWLRAILRNDLYAVTMTEDQGARNWAAAKLILAALYDLLPDEIWGGHEQYEAHVDGHRADAQLAAKRWRATVQTAENSQTMGRIIAKGWRK